MRKVETDDTMGNHIDWPEKEVPLNNGDGERKIGLGTRQGHGPLWEKLEATSVHFLVSVNTALIKRADRKVENFMSLTLPSFRQCFLEPTLSKESFLLFSSTWLEGSNSRVGSRDSGYFPRRMKVHPTVHGLQGALSWRNRYLMWRIVAYVLKVGLTRVVSLMCSKTEGYNSCL